MLFNPHVTPRSQSPEVPARPGAHVPAASAFLHQNPAAKAAWRNVLRRGLPRVPGLPLDLFLSEPAQGTVLGTAHHHAGLAVSHAARGDIRVLVVGDIVLPARAGAVPAHRAADAVLQAVLRGQAAGLDTLGAHLATMRTALGTFAAVLLCADAAQPAMTAVSAGVPTQVVLSRSHLHVVLGPGAVQHGFALRPGHAVHLGPRGGVLCTLNGKPVHRVQAESLPAASTP